MAVKARAVADSRPVMMLKLQDKYNSPDENVEEVEQRHCEQPSRREMRQKDGQKVRKSGTGSGDVLVGWCERKMET